MSEFDISGAKFNEHMRMLEPTDPAHADTFNAMFQQLLENDVALKDSAVLFGGTKNQQALFLLNLHKDGKKYGVHFDDFSISPASKGTRLFDAVGLEAAPSTNTVRAQNDFDGKGCFAYIEVNGYVDESGEFQVEYIKDVDNEFSRTERDTWCLYLTQFISFTINANGEDTVISDTRHSQMWVPEGAAIRKDGTIRPFVAIAKYHAGKNADGVASSISGVVIENYSFQKEVTEFHKKGIQYCGETSQDSERMTRLMEIAFATRHSQSVMAGCSSFWWLYEASVQEDDVERIIIPKSQAANLVVGCCVNIGNATSLNAENKPNIDRWGREAELGAKARKVNVIKIEEYDSANSAVYVDNGGKKFSTAPNVVSGVPCPTVISGMPWHTGACDNVLGSCGSPTNNKSGKEPYILFGVEMSIGCWEPKGNTVMVIKNHVMTPYICYDCTKMTTDGATDSAIAAGIWVPVGYNIPDCQASWKYISKLGYDPANPEARYPIGTEATSSNGYADGVYTQKLSEMGDGQREVLSVGYLNYGAGGGRRVADLGLGLGYSYWHYAARLSASGQCGRKASA